MQKTFTSDYLSENCGCYEVEEAQAAVNPTGKKELTVVDVLAADIPLKDKYWFVCRKLATKEENQQIAIKVAELVLPIYEKRYPDDKRPLEAIEAAKQYIAGHISFEMLIEKRDAAAAAADAAYAAYAAAAADADAAAAAADAAYADADAAYAAADAAYAAYAAAAADADAAYADAIKKQLEDYLYQVCGVEREVTP